ncbi:MAG: carboxylating nicotinate-nucleotide diphosphorylase [Bacteroidota bacterium]|jgi:nicotinate-nucleotide pyrophosphorylase (carboxylating)|nr:carboxylating nicotinate-nucleotide diphosphorylase [Bacteroidota bacterium]
MRLSLLHDSAMLQRIEAALREDVGTGDITTECTVPTDLQGEGVFVAKANGVLSGLEVAATVFHLVDEDLVIDARFTDGMPVLRGADIARVTGSIASMLTAERVALNFLQRMSGIATATAGFVKLIEGSDARILDTRKTVPGLRAFDKLAVRHGRGSNHRFGLDDMVLIKDNHIAAAGGLRAAVELVVNRMPAERGIKVEVEVADLNMLIEALGCTGIDVIMLDNMTVDEMTTAVKLVRARRPEIKIEASGNVSEQTVRAIAESGVDMISIGALTHSVRALDISFNISAR